MREQLIGRQRLICGDCLEVLPCLPESSVDLIATDPPYYRVKDLPWDRQWDSPAAFVEWIGKLCEQWQRVLKPNGSLYVFASPKMAARVECEVGRWFEVLNRVRWIKEAGWHQKADKAVIRSYLSPWEEIIFAEQFGADSSAKGEAGYIAVCNDLRGFVFEPLRAYLDGERRLAGVSFEQVRGAVGCAPGSGLPSHWFTQSQWMLPTEQNYLRLRALFNECSSGQHLRREYEDLRREYEDLRREYEDLRRPFAVTADVPYTDVWNFPTVSAYPGKHPCEKPLAMMEHIIRTSSREGATVLDCFMGSGVTGEAARNLGREFIGIELDEHYCEIAAARIRHAQPAQFAFAAE
jgi:site-specific DNA-methyltransferase (adenine-specific)